ncbi:hypothetical protein [Aeoliella mucimassa]|uniref:Uncharacterized protein n=1 Tax=Aeoliella mucimassa TaxID=2527972 RepID=A0A518AV10_9BACT|nr:hypothetical protein [Aeoliella mucimassa]QDU58565.1 hypothetical protein Pan181_48040 [Aeoliella mucimassa]
MRISLDSLVFADEQRRLIAFTRVLAIAVLCCLVVSWKLWVSRPYYPLVPLLEGLPSFSHPFDYAWLGMLVASLLGIVVRPRSQVLIAIVLAAFGVLFLQDQSRLWPSFYMFCLYFVLLVSHRGQEGEAADERILAGLRFVAAMVYFWGGVQKLNPYFFYNEFPWFVEPVVKLLPFETTLLPTLAVLAAVCEVLIGVGLLTTRLRHLALIGAMLMHLLILFSIGPLRSHWNNSSWMWGMSVAVLTWTLFWQAPAFRLQKMFAAPRLQSAPQWLVVLLVGILPVLNNFNRWDSALSFNVYSGNVDYAEIHLRPQAVPLLPDEIAERVDVGFGNAVLVLNKWSLHEFKANTYPETRVFKAVFRKVGSYLPEGSAQLYVGEKAGWFFPKRIDRYELNSDGEVELKELGVEAPTP